MGSTPVGDNGKRLNRIQVWVAGLRGIGQPSVLFADLVEVLSGRYERLSLRSVFCVAWLGRAIEVTLLPDHDPYLKTSFQRRTFNHSST